MTRSLPSKSVALPFAPSVLAWSDDGNRIVAGGSFVSFVEFGSAGLAVIDTVTGALTWHLDGWNCTALQVAGSLVATGLFRGGFGSSDPLESRLTVHDLISGEQSWQRDGILGRGLSADPGGRWLAVNASGHYALLDLKTGEDLAQIALQPVPRFRPAISPTGRQLAVADATRVAIADLSTGAILHEVSTSSAAAVAEFDDTGSTLTTVDLDGFVTVVDTASGNQISRSFLAEAHLDNTALAQAGRPVALSPDRQIVAVAGIGRTAMFAARTGELLGALPATHNQWIYAAFSPDARAAVVTQILHDATLVAAPRPRELWTQGPVQMTVAAFSRAGRLAVAQRQSPTQGMALIDVVAPTGPLLDIAEGTAPGAAAVLGVDVTGAGTKLVASISSDGAARLYAVEAGELLYERPHPGALTDVAFLQGGQSFVTACTDGAVRLFDTVAGQRRWLVQHSGPVNALACPPRGEVVCSASSDKTVRCIDASTGAERWRAAFPQAVTRVVVSPDAGFAVAACSDRTARVLSMQDGAERWQVRHDFRIRALAVSPDGGAVATASEDGSVLVLASDSGLVRRQVSHVRGATSAVFSADGQAVISGSLDGVVLVSSVSDATAAPVQLMHSPAPVTQIVRNGTDPSVAVVTDDGTVRVVDLGLRAELVRLCHDAPARDIAADTGGGLLASGFDDGTLRVYAWPRA